MGMFDSLAHSLGIGGNALAPDKVSVQNVVQDQGLLDQNQTAMNNLGQVANTDVTGVSVGGQAGLDYLKKLSASQRDQVLRDQQSQSASAIANANRYGGGAGNAERAIASGQKNAQQALQGVGSDLASNQAQLTATNIGQNEQNKFTALSAMPQLTSQNLAQDTNLNMFNTNQQNKANLANVANQQAFDASSGSLFNSIAGGAASGLTGGFGMGAAKSIFG